MKFLKEIGGTEGLAKLLEAQRREQEEAQKRQAAEDEALEKKKAAEVEMQ